MGPGAIGAAAGPLPGGCCGQTALFPLHPAGSPWRCWLQRHPGPTGASWLDGKPLCIPAAQAPVLLFLLSLPSVAAPPSLPTPTFTELLPPVVASFLPSFPSGTWDKEGCQASGPSPPGQGRHHWTPRDPGTLRTSGMLGDLSMTTARSPSSWMHMVSVSQSVPQSPHMGHGASPLITVPWDVVHCRVQKGTKAAGETW